MTPTARDSHDCRHGLYDSLHDSAMQRRFRALAPMPFGVVFLPWKGMRAQEIREQEIRAHFRLMRELGFTNLKQTMGTPEWLAERVVEVALEEGIIPYWYGIGGWEEISPQLLRRLGVPRDLSVDEAMERPGMIAHQTDVIRKRIRYDRSERPDVGGGAGGEMGLFLPFAWRGTDMEGIAEKMREARSFYRSIHLAWYFEEVGYEMPLTVYMQSSISADWFNGGEYALLNRRHEPSDCAIEAGAPITVDGHSARWVRFVKRG